MKSIISLLLILLNFEFVSLKAQEIESRYKTPTAVKLRNIEKLETNAKFFLIESGVFGAVGIGCLAGGIVKELIGTLYQRAKTTICRALGQNRKSIDRNWSRFYCCIGSVRCLGYKMCL